MLSPIIQKALRLLLKLFLVDAIRGGYAFIHKKFQDMAARRRIKAENKAIKEQNEAAQNSEDRESAARNLIDKL
jgi:hypothetical protein